VLNDLMAMERSYIREIRWKKRPLYILEMFSEARKKIISRVDKNGVLSDLEHNLGW